MGLKFSQFTALTAIIFISCQCLFAQVPLVTPQASQKASISQTIGLTEITINYHRPGVKDRVIWGKLVPYNVVWRAGANENTTISFSDPVKIEGKDLPAGTYGLHMIPTENEWTIIFNKNYWSWGSFFYDQKDDALRITVKPQQSEMHEWLTYYFNNPQPGNVNVALNWEKLKVSFNVDVNLHQNAMANFEKQLNNLPGFSWQAFNQAADYAQQNNLDLDNAMTLSDRSINMNRNATNLIVKSDILSKMGNNSEAAKLKEEALDIGTENEINAMGYRCLFANKINEAIEIFKKNVEDHPDSWNVYDSLGEAYAANGNEQEAIELYKKARKMVKDQVNQQRIDNILQGLQSN